MALVPPITQDPRLQHVTPAAPGNPPAVGDLQVAHDYTAEVLLSRNEFDPQSASNDDFGRVLLYEYNVAQAVSAAVFPVGGPPPWLAAALAAALQPFQQQLAQIQQQLTRIEVNVARSANSHRGSGSVVVYDIIPFADGSDPTAPPHNLTPLRRAANINTLAGPASALYCQGYGIQPVPNTIAARRRAIKRHIGCKV